jgi:hypothetical protein
MNRRSPALLATAEGRKAVASKEEAAGIAQLVERQPSKLNVTGSNPVSRSTLALAAAQETKTSAHLAQSVEHVLGKDEVTSSILVVGSSVNEANEGTEP